MSFHANHVSHPAEGSRRGAAGRFLHDRMGRLGLVPPAARTVDIVLVAALALTTFAIGSLAWPLYPGRDTQSYLIYYLDIGSAQPVFPLVMLFRTPGAPLFFGLLLDLGGAPLAEAAMGVCYVLAIIAFYLVGSFWSRRVGLATAVALCLYPGYGALYHNVSSDGLFAFGVAIWSVFICATAAAPTARKFAAHGAAIFLLIMIRPSALLFLGIAGLLPFLLKDRFTAQLRNAVVCVVTGLALVSSWATYNKLRYGDFTVSRLVPLTMPLFRLLNMDRLIKPENGPASGELARAIESDLLTEEPYRSYGITLDRFLNTGRIRMWADLAGLSDRTWGWHSDYAMLRAVSREAIMQYPLRYAKGVARTFEEMLLVPYAPGAPAWPPLPRTIICDTGCVKEGFVTVNGKSVPLPWDGSDPIPMGHDAWLASTPDNSISTDWSDLSRPRLRFVDPNAELRYEALARNLRAMMDLLPSRPPMASVTYHLNAATMLFPSMWLTLVIGALGLVFRPEKHLRLLLYFAGTGLLLILANSCGLPASPQYRVPMDPYFILFGMAGLIGSGGLSRNLLRHK